MTRRPGPFPPKGRFPAGDWVRFLRPAITLLLFSGALFALHYALRGYQPRELARSLAMVPRRSLAVAQLLTALNYFVLTGYDVLAFRYLGTALPYRRVALASFAGFAFANNTGTFSLLAGGSVRYRLYTGWGLSASDIARVVAFCTLTFWLGFLALGGLAFLLEPVTIPEALRVPTGSLRVFGAFFLLAVGGYLVWGVLRKRPFRVGGWEIQVPPFGLSAAQIGLSAGDWLLASGVLFTLLPAGSRPSFPFFVGLFLLAQVVGLASTVPGGLGVFEGTMVLLLAPFLPTPSALGPLIAFRCVYYLVPLLFSALALAAYEVVLRREALGRAALTLSRPLSRAVPHVLALAVFASGAVLLFSGAAPAVGSRIGWLRDAVPLPVVEVSHFVGSLAGVGLLVLARGLQHRVDAAYFLSAALLAVGIGASLLKGLDYEEALILAALLAALLPCRREFHRKASLVAEMLSPRWVGALALVLAASLWIGVVAYRYEEYSNELWWRFAFTGDAPRFLRASVGVCALLLVLAVARLLRPGGPRAAPPDAGSLEAAAAIAVRAARTDGYLALLADKALLFSPERDAFLMYGVQGRSWVAMGDPVGPEERAEELVWAFRELSDRHGGRPVFYEVGTGNLPLYLDLGLAPLKIGEQARVPLADFSLEGGTHRGLRASRNRAVREGCSFEIAPPEALPGLLAELRALSEAWLAEKRTREKGFSLGYFREDYLRHFPCALVRRDGRVAAFSNLWPGGGREELSADLMRFAPDAPNGTMDYLFAELLLWGREQGYRWFNLGMAPLAGLEDRALAPLWNRLGAFLFRHGENFYNFQGLRAYKEKFEPVWEPRYLVCRGAVELPRVLLDVAALVSGGLRGVIAK